MTARERAAAVPDHTYYAAGARCFRKHYYRFERGLTGTEESAPLLAGSAIHTALQKLYEADDWQRALPAALDALRNVFGDREFQMGNKRPWTLSAGHLEVVMKNYVDEYAERDPWRVVATIEEPLVGEISKAPFGGIPDLVVDEGGDYLIVDHKTTSGWLGSNHRLRIQMQKQLPLYCLLAQQEFGVRVRKAVVNAIYVGQYATNPDSKAAKFDRYPMPPTGEFSEGQLEEAEAWVRRQRDLLEFLRRADNGESAWPQNGGDHCRYCSFRRLCEAPPERREGLIQKYYEHDEPEGILLSGADSND